MIYITEYVQIADRADQEPTESAVTMAAIGWGRTCSSQSENSNVLNVVGGLNYMDDFACSIISGGLYDEESILCSDGHGNKGPCPVSNTILYVNEDLNQYTCVGKFQH